MDKINDNLVQTYKHILVFLEEIDRSIREQQKIKEAILRQADFLWVESDTSVIKKYVNNILRNVEIQDDNVYKGLFLKDDILFDISKILNILKKIVSDFFENVKFKLFMKDDCFFYDPSFILQVDLIGGVDDEKYKSFIERIDSEIYMVYPMMFCDVLSLNIIVNDRE